LSPNPHGRCVTTPGRGTGARHRYAGIHACKDHHREESLPAQILEAHGESREGEHLAFCIHKNRIDCVLRQKRDAQGGVSISLRGMSASLHENPAPSWERTSKWRG
jgi:hypothetical protein